MGGSRDVRVTSPATSSCCGSCCEVHQAPLQGPRPGSSCCSAPSCHHVRHHHRHSSHHHHHHHPHHRVHHHRRQRGSRQAATSASSCSSSSPPSSPPRSLRRYPLPAPAELVATSVAPGQTVTASPFELRRLPVSHCNDCAYSFVDGVMGNVTRWRYWQGSGLAIHRSRVPVMTGHHCVVALGKLLTPMCLCHQAV